MSERMLELFGPVPLSNSQLERIDFFRRMFQNLANDVVNFCPSGPERTVALRKLLEGKDAAVRAVIFPPLKTKHGSDGILESVGEQRPEERFETLKAALGAVGDEGDEER